MFDVLLRYVLNILCVPSCACGLFGWRRAHHQFFDRLFERILTQDGKGRSVVGLAESIRDSFTKGHFMAKRWSKLKKPIEDLFVPDLPLQVHCTDIRTTTRNEGSRAEILGVFIVRLRKDVIWNFPRQFVNEAFIYPGGGNHYSYGVRDLNGLLREYLDTPKDVLLNQDFARDYFCLTNILKAADRRLGLKRLERHFDKVEQDSVVNVLAARIALLHS